MDRLKCVLAFTILGVLGLGILYVFWHVPQLLLFMGGGVAVSWAVHQAFDCLGL